VIYLAVYRHPDDVRFSLEKHVANKKNDVLRFHFPEAPGAAFERFIMRRVTTEVAKKGIGPAFSDTAGFSDAATSYKWVGRLSDAKVSA
jgi:hypothetical protein